MKNSKELKLVKNIYAFSEFSYTRVKLNKFKIRYKNTLLILNLFLCFSFFSFLYLLFIFSLIFFLKFSNNQTSNRFLLVIFISK